jgi:hypothetical protein
MPRRSPAFPLQPRSDLQRIQSATPSDLPSRTSHPAGEGKRRLGGDDPGCLKWEGTAVFSSADLGCQFRAAFDLTRFS